MKISEIIVLLQQDGWTQNVSPAPTGISPTRRKPGLVTVAGKPSATLKPKTDSSILKQAGLRKERP